MGNAQEQSEWVFPTEKARAHDASVTLIINGIYCTYLRYLFYTPTFTVRNGFTVVDLDCACEGQWLSSYVQDSTTN